MKSRLFLTVAAASSLALLTACEEPTEQPEAETLEPAAPVPEENFEVDDLPTAESVDPSFSDEPMAPEVDAESSLTVPDEEGEGAPVESVEDQPLEIEDDGAE